MTSHFNAAAHVKISSFKAEIDQQNKKKRPSPLSLRLSDDERALLEEQAGRQSLGSYIKSQLFDVGKPKKKSKRHRVVQDYEALARVLSALGQTELFSNMSALVDHIENGSVVLTPEAEEQIGVACACVLLMRDDLVTALGLEAE